VVEAFATSATSNNATAINRVKPVFVGVGFSVFNGFEFEGNETVVVAILGPSLVKRCILQMERYNEDIFSTRGT
jgi:hypothetical protein